MSVCGDQCKTGCEWLARGRGEDPDRPKTALYAEFADAVEKAQATDEIITVGRIKQAGQGGAVLARKTTRYPDGREVTEERYAQPEWTADAWWLERKHFQRWGRRERKELTGADGGAIEVSDPFMHLLARLWEADGEFVHSNGNGRHG